MTLIAWHFLSADWTAYGGFQVKVGEAYHVDGEIVPCANGLHASTRAIDALGYARGPIVTLVRCSGTIVEHSDKFTCSDRVGLWGYDATEELRCFARRCAFDALRAWPSAPAVVHDYLKTGDERDRVPAWIAARDVAYGVTRDNWDSEQDAAWAAAWAASRETPWTAAWTAARAVGYWAIEDNNCALESILMDGAVARGFSW